MTTTVEIAQAALDKLAKDLYVDPRGYPWIQPVLQGPMLVATAFVGSSRRDDTITRCIEALKESTGLQWKFVGLSRGQASFTAPMPKKE